MWLKSALVQLFLTIVPVLQCTGITCSLSLRCILGVCEGVSVC